MKIVDIIRAQFYVLSPRLGVKIFMKNRQMLPAALQKVTNIMIRVSGVTVPLTQLIKLLTSSLILSLTLGVSASSLAEQGNAEAGKQKSATCAACHGADGNSPLDQFPKIAGQVPGYVAGQLHSFQSQERNNAIMMGMVGSLSDQDMADMDAFYASQEMSTGSISADQEVEARAGESI